VQLDILNISGFILRRAYPYPGDSGGGGRLSLCLCLCREDPSQQRGAYQSRNASRE